MIKYLVHPGYVKSRFDGDRHYITGQQLIKLYGLNPRKCYVMTGDVKDRGFDKENMIHLYPKSSGDYQKKEK